MTNDLFTKADLEQMEKLGITEDEAKRQLAILEKGQRWTALERPCTLGDGIAVLDPEDQERFISRWQEGADKGRLSAFFTCLGCSQSDVCLSCNASGTRLDRVTLDEIAKKFSEIK